MDTTPLFEEKRYVLFPALTAYRDYAIAFHRPCTETAFAADMLALTKTHDPGALQKYFDN